MGFIGIGAVLALLLAFIMLLAKARHDRGVRLIHQTPVTTIADLVQSFTAHADPASPTRAAVQGCVVASGCRGRSMGHDTSDGSDHR